MICWKRIHSGVRKLYVHEVTLTKNLQVDVADTNAVHGDDNHLVTHPQGEIAKVLKNHLISKQNNQNPQGLLSTSTTSKCARHAKDNLHPVENLKN